MIKRVSLHGAKNKNEFFLQLNDKNLVEQAWLFGQMMKQCLATAPHLERALRNFRFGITQMAGAYVIKDAAALYIAA